MTEDRCTCPPAADVFRGHVGQTREPCPVHPEPDFPPGTFVERVDFSDATFSTDAFPLSREYPVTNDRRAG